MTAAQTPDMLPEPAITIGIPVWNRETLVRKSVESALRQPGDDIEILVVDNASTDRTWDVLCSYHDPRLRLVRNDRNVGLFGNFNRCIRLARGRYVVTLCSDDVLRDGFLEPARRLLDADPQLTVVSPRGLAIDEKRGGTFVLGGTLPAGRYAPGDAIAAILWAHALYYKNPLNYPSGILLRRDAALEQGVMDESMRYGADMKLYLGMLDRGALAILDRTSCEVLIHTGQENEAIFQDLRHVREYADHYVRYASVIEQHGLAGHVRSHLGGYLLGTYARLRRMGRSEVAAECMQLFRDRGHTLAPSVNGLMDSLRRRGRLKRDGRLTSPVPVTPLTDTSASSPPAVTAAPATPVPA